MTTDTELSTDVRDGEIAVVEQPINPTEARNRAVADALAEAYERASHLELTKEESDALKAPFADEAFARGAAGKENLIYIEHAYLRQRLNDVLGIGAAVPIRRREWAEELVRSVKVYVETVLIVRGCFVAEAIGSGEYFKSNAAQDYSDAFESAKTNALRRCCKEFGIGLQAWQKGWVAGWLERNPIGKKQPPPPAKKTPAEMNQDLANRFDHGGETLQASTINNAVKIAAMSQATLDKTEPWILEQCAEGKITEYERDHLMTAIVKRRNELEPVSVTVIDGQRFDERGMPANEPATA